MTLRKITGYSLLAVSCIAWGVLPVIPFLPIEGNQKLSWAAAVFIFAEITWWVSMPLLGPEIIELMSKWWLWTKSFLRAQRTTEAIDQVDKEDC